MASFNDAHIAKHIILTSLHRYVAYPLSYRKLEELMQEWGVCVDPSIILRRVLRYALQIEAVFHRRKRSVCPSVRRRPVDLSWDRVHAHAAERLTGRGANRATRWSNNSTPWPHNPQLSKALYIIAQNLRHNYLIRVHK